MLAVSLAAVIGTAIGLMGIRALVGTGVLIDRTGDICRADRSDDARGGRSR